MPINWQLQQKEKKKKKIQKNVQNKSKHKNNKCFSWVTAVRMLSFTGSHSSPQLPNMPFNTVLDSGPATWAAQNLIWSYSCVFCLQCPQLSKLVCFLLWELLLSFYIFRIHKVCLVDRVDLICSLDNWWEGLRSSLDALPLGFNCGFISTSVGRSSTALYSWGCPGGLGSAPVRASCGGGAAAWVTVVLAAPGTQGSWQLGQHEV